MPVSLDFITDGTPMGANLVEGGATFRVWAPAAREVYVIGRFNNFERNDASLLNRLPDGIWAGFVPGAAEWQEYEFYVVGEGSEGPKRDPFARELTPNWPESNCILRASGYRWNDAGFRTPPFHKMIIYQLHVGTFFAPRWPQQAGTFLDVVEKIEYLAALGINVLQLLPIVEFQTTFSMGYNGTDYFSPEMDFEVADQQLVPHRETVDRLLQAKGMPASGPDDLRGSANQLKMLVNLCHLYGIAVIFDVVYNHAGGDFGDESIYFFDRQPIGDNNRSQYFLNVGHAGGLVFAFWKQEVRQFLIDNAKFFLEEYHVDGFRYDQVSVIVADAANDGWPFCQALTGTLRFLNPEALQHAEYWPVDPYIAKPTAVGGAGFDTSLHDGLRDSIRGAVFQSGISEVGPVDFDSVAGHLRAQGFDAAWQAVQGIENHDIVYRGRGPRIPRLGDGNDPRSWFARSRSRVALGLNATAPGIPMIFMGQEFLAAEQWADDLDNYDHLRIDWGGAEGGDRHMADFLEFTQALFALRNNLPALTGEGIRPYHIHNSNRVLAFHRWVPGVGDDVVVVASLNQNTFGSYNVGFPGGGAWREVFNSDFYDNLPNPQTRGNAGSVFAGGPPMHGFGASATIVLPANCLLLFAR